MSPNKPKALYIMGKNTFAQIYGTAEQADIARLVDVIAPPQTPDSIRENPALLANVELILSGWGCPKMDEAFLAHAPNLKAVFYGAGSIRGWATDAVWDRNLVVTAAWAANAVPVAEFTLAQIILSLKQMWHYVVEGKRTSKRIPAHARTCAGGYNSTVGLVSLGMIGRRVARLLQALEVRTIAYDPFVTPAAGRELNVEMTSLDEVFQRADVVSLHTPWLKETEGMITGSHFASMKPNATFINTARGAVVREDEMIAVLQNRPDLTVLLDVTYPEPPKEGSPLYTLPNVILTPHIAGSKDAECNRMGRYMVEELQRYLANQPLMWQITRERAKLLA